ncbi:cytochrome P450 [Xylaria digitata]|nr:cytochrome P450 [Xylaria digitata]
MFLGPVLGYMIWSVATLVENVRKARQLDVPYICLPADGNNVFWAIFQPYVWSILDRLPFQWSSYPDFIRYSRRGWEYTDRSSTHVHLGPVWALITPAAVYLQFADPDAIKEIFTRRSDFVRPTKEYKLLEVYGPCVSTAGDDWARHRRVLAAPFSESIMEFVWDESLRQARSMLRYWSSAGESGIPSMQRDTRTLSLNVLASTAFRKSYSFHGSANPQTDEASSYRDSLQTVLDNIVPLMLIPYRLLASPLIPERWAKVGNAAVSFKEHMLEMLEHETKALKDGMPGSGGIMTAFARALKTHSEETNSSQPSTEIFKKGLSVDEIFGNIFVINFAGHDTTAVTLAFTMLLLAANLPVQEWVSEEILAVTKDIPTEEWDYKSLFPALNRTRAVLLETLRVYPPIMGLPKWTSQKAQTISVGGRTLTIPSGVSSVICLKAIQSHPDYWVDPYDWKPSRWISQANSVSTSSTRIEQHLHEQLLLPRPNTYFPWSDGPQKCPGKKFAEVEAVAVLACLFKQHRVLVKKMANESDEAAQSRAIACTNDVTLEALLKMANADQVTLTCNRA